MPSDEANAQPGWFMTTRWSVVVNAAQPDSATSSAALEQLCQCYWAPIYRYLRRRGHDPEQSKDLTQEFFRQILARNALVSVDRQKGKFRSFLLASVNHFITNEWERASAQKRGGGRAVVSLDDSVEAIVAADPKTTEPPELGFDRQWAFTILQRGLVRLEEEFRRAGKAIQFEKLNRYITEPAADDDYAAIAAELQTKPGTIGVWVHRMRQQYRDLVRAEVAETVATTAEIDEEMRYLLSVLE